MKQLGSGTDAARVMKDVIQEYEKNSLLAYLIFITYGAISYDVKPVIEKASKLPIFCNL